VTKDQRRAEPARDRVERLERPRRQRDAPAVRVVFPYAFALPNANRLRERVDLLRLRLRVAAG
jgi:hypothetical protein